MPRTCPIARRSGILRTGIEVAGAEALFAVVEQQILQHGYLARGGQIIDANLVPAPKQHFIREDNAQLKEKAVPATGAPPNVARKIWSDLDEEAWEKQPWLQALCQSGTQTLPEQQEIIARQSSFRLLLGWVLGVLVTVRRVS